MHGGRRSRRGVIMMYIKARERKEEWGRGRERDRGSGSGKERGKEGGEEGDE